MNIKNIQWGVWGYGVVGKSVAQFLHERGARVAIYDQKNDITIPEQYTVYRSSELQAFLEEQLNIVPSPGIDISEHYATYHTKFVSELDLFYTFFKKPIIAITGSVGKTTITRILSMFLENVGYRILTGGNIGTGMCELIDQQKDCDFAILEVSSFQLEYNKIFSPFLAIITPFYPNHLDRHKTVTAYRNAKLRILTYQTQECSAIIPQALIKYCKRTKSTIIGYQKNKKDRLIKKFPPLTFPENMNILAKIIRVLNIDQSLAIAAMHSIALKQEHRLEHVIAHNDIHFINDSKSTTPASTLAAVNYYKGKSIHLLLGGLSKGICRKQLIQSLQSRVTKIYCFGDESLQLYNWCKMYDIPASHHQNLSRCLTDAYKNAEQNSIILLSPAGSSYDLFKNYEERGTLFKKQVSMIIQK